PGRSEQRVCRRSHGRVRRVIVCRSLGLYLQRAAMRDGRRIEVRGTVQGVGFRPWVYRLAQKHDVAGRVSNDSRGVVIDLYADDEQIDRFIDELDRAAPPASRIEVITCHPVPFEMVDGFTIVPSARG